MRAAAVLVLLGLLLLPAPAQADSETVFTFADGRIRESSGLVDLGELMVTVNDSGDTGRVFTVDPRTGETVGVTDYAAEAVDVEALAPAGRRSVWVGDIGDNLRRREEVLVHRVPVGRGQRDVRPRTFRLRYPDRAHDAEALFADRRGRLHVITKSFSGGTVYRAPARLDPRETNLLEPVVRLDEYVTDAALLRGGRHVLVRGPGRATVHALPGFAVVGSFALPRQQQGEAVSVGPDGRIRVSTEGAGTPVHEVDLPAELAGRMQGQATETPSATPTPIDPDDPARQDGGPGPDWLPWASGVALVVVVLALGRAATISRRSR